ncbi:DUF4178 domain-containing protein [Actinokineospora iranica]|uniref:DUF4178 domain-containing protein n=1 Tax=Actinokineospora iranica TaxID=1271860 RepID=A0A1G6YZQ0_9PSEU|nr:DUF4178 domain-containing protein [Actinokineospora iranica]SDD95127.1 protein of unknown function [Actinokineospora iranica]
MDGLVVVLIVVVAVAVGALVTAVVLRNKNKVSPKKAPVDPFADNDHHAVYGDPRALKAGDLVELRGESYAVRGSLRLDEGGWTWSEHLLEKADGERVWLSVEEDPNLVLVAWTEQSEGSDDSTALEPGPKSLSYQGKQYRSDESGRAAYRSEATTGLTAEGTVRYHDYESGDGALLSFEAYGDAGWEVSTGVSLSTYDIRIYPASTE